MRQRSTAVSDSSGLSRIIGAQKNSILRGGRWALVVQMVSVGAGLSITPFIINNMGVGRYGLYIFLASLAAFFSTADGGMTLSAQRYFAKYLAQGRAEACRALYFTVTMAAFVVGGVITSILVILASAIARLATSDATLASEGAIFLYCLGPIVFFGYVRSLNQAYLSACTRYAAVSLTSLTGLLIFLIGVVIAVQFGLGVGGLAAALVAQQGIAGALAIAITLPSLQGKGIKLMQRSELSAFIRFSLKVQSVGLVGLTNTQADALITGAVMSVRSVGYLNAGTSLANQARTIPALLLGPISINLTYAFASGENAGPGSKFELYQRRWVWATTCWSTCALSAGYFAVTAWLGPEFGSSGLVAVIALLGIGVNLWTGVLTSWLTVSGRPGLEVYYSIVSLVINIALTAILIVPLGIVGVILATASGQVVSSLYLLVLVRRKLPYSIKSYLSEVPWLLASLTALVVFTLEFVAAPFLPVGILGLILVALIALPGAGLYVWLGRKGWYAD